MIFTIVILKEVMIMNNPEKQASYSFEPWITKLFGFKAEKDNKKVLHPFSVILYKEIADQLGITLSTVRAHLHTVYEKLHVQSRTEAVVKFLGRG